ncbi:transferase [Notoacmeibacter marinus]|uniref:Transferase n=1 Tax=Notoacmeibacter marinus TaxID=1876515 RepID=A0A231V396_9HYPH|nr:acetyltransferase [Notoacmeibacter marinus]OXT02649.1 transferase [Notoacmeibacter marinus]
MPKPIVIFGTGELAEVAAFYFEADAGREIAAFTIDGDRIGSNRFAGKAVLPFEDIVTSHGPGDHDLFVAVGYSGLNDLRAAKCAEAEGKGYTLPSYVSSRATTFSDFACGSNCFILEDNTIQPFVRIGRGVTLWSGNHIGHHSSIGDFAFISSHVVISGGVSVGAHSFIGVNATTNDHIAIGARCVIGSGTTVAKSIPDETVITSEPGKIAKIPSSRLRGF